MKNKLLKISFILLSILLVVPSFIYIISNRTLVNFDIYFNFFLNENANKIIATITFLILFLILFVIYILIIKKNVLKNIKQVLIFVSIISIIFLFMLPWTSSDVFYYMGVGELDGIYGQNPYYITMRDFYYANQDKINDEILEKGATNAWSDTTVVYGPVSQIIFKICSILSFKSVDIAIIIFKLLNLLIHILCCYLIYKITNKRIFAIIYGLNPFILMEFIGNVHNDIIMVFVILLSLYFLLKKKNLALSVIFLAIATGIKYFSILLLPLIIIYHVKQEKKISTRILKCILYGLLFIIVLGLIYAIYYRDIEILKSMFAQTNKYSRSIYSVMYQINPAIIKIVKTALYTLFILYYLKFCIDLLTDKNIKFNYYIRRYNRVIILFSFLLGTFQIWYISWLFATFMWQRPNMIKNIVGITLIAELATSIYMFTSESYIYDKYFIETVIVLLLVWQIFTNKRLKNNSKLNSFPTRFAH